VVHEQTGLLVEEYDTAALSRAMTKMLDKTYRLTLGTAARKFTEEKFDIRICNLRLKEIYQEAVGR
jgi:glycosyltransferase involved in cell wall biosynthesis